MGEERQDESRFTVLREISTKLFDFAVRWEGEEHLVQRDTAQPKGGAAEGDSALVLKAERIYRGRRKREKVLPSKLLGEPAWDILLDLFISAVRGRKVRMTSASIAGSVPPTTGLRWMAVLESEGLVERYAEESDRRVANVQLTEAGLAAVRECLMRID